VQALDGRQAAGYVRAVTRFMQAMGWLALLVFLLPALGYLLVLLVSHPRPPATFAAWYGLFVLVWFVVALPVVALLWAIPPLPRAAVAAVVVYLVALVVPLASGMARYPLHIIRCGHLPVVGTTFAAGYTYTLPGNSAYEVTPFSDRFFCSREDATAHGFHESSI
jgi:asparagine N-glycosylation enzyme membrane subunit Stt3